MKLLIVIAVLLLLGSCKRDDKACLTSAGEEVVKTADLGSFSSLVVRNNVNVTLVKGTVNRAEITGGEHLVNAVSLELTGDTLEINELIRCDWFRAYDKSRIHVRIELVDPLLSITQYGSGLIENEDTLFGTILALQSWDAGGNISMTVDVDTLSCGIHTGTCDITVKGRATHHFAYCAGVGNINGLQLESQNAYVNNSGPNDILVWAENYLEAFINYAGDIIYRGQPVIYTIKEGTGSLISQ